MVLVGFDNTGEYWIARNSWVSAQESPAGCPHVAILIWSPAGSSLHAAAWGLIIQHTCKQRV